MTDLVFRLKFQVDKSSTEGFLSGIQKGVFGGPSGGSFTKMAGGIGLVGVLMNQSLDLMKKMTNFLGEMSPALRQVMKMFERSIMLFFKPFADFLAQSLRPMTQELLKMARSWNRYWREMFGTKEQQELAGAGTLFGGVGGGILGTLLGGFPYGTAVGAAAGAVGAPAIGATIGEWLNETLGPEASKKLWDIVAFGPLTALGPDFAAWLWTALQGVWTYTEDFGTFIWESLQGVWNYAQDFGTFIWDNLKSVWNYTENFGTWLWEQLQTIWNYMEDYGGWLWIMIKTIWNYTNDFGSWLWDQLKGIWEWTWNFGSWLWDKLKGIWEWKWDFGLWLWREITKIFGGDGSGGGYQHGVSHVPETGMYMLHKNETVTTAGATPPGGGSFMYNPAFTINSGLTDADIRRIVEDQAEASYRELAAKLGR